MRNRYQSTSQSNTIQTTENTAVVYSIILDSNHPKYKDASDIGAITFRMLASNDASAVMKDTELPVAHPFDKSFIDLPIRNIFCVSVGHVSKMYFEWPPRMKSKPPAAARKPPPA